MIEAPRPSTLGEILDRTAHMYRSRFLVFLGIAGLPVGVVLSCAVTVFLFFAWLGTDGQKAGTAVIGAVSILFLLAGMVVLPLCAAVAALGEGALNHAAVAAFQGETVTIRCAYKAAWPRGWRYIGLWLLQALMVFVAPLLAATILILIVAVSAGLMAKSSEEAGGAIGGLMLLLLAVLAAYAVWALLMLCLSFPACVVENATAWTAIKRAVSLSKGTRGRILVLYALGIALRWGLSTLLTVPAFLIVYLVPGLDTPQHARLVATILMLVVYCGSFAVRAFTKPVYVIAEMLFYYDQRIRKEGFDIEWMMRQAGMVDAPAPAPEAAPWIAALPGKTSAPGFAVESGAGVAAGYPARAELQAPFAPALEAAEPAGSLEIVVIPKPEANTRP